MLKITVPGSESYDDVKNRFVYADPFELRLEHSLASLSKWESKWCVPFLNTTDKTPEQTIDYIRCMALDDDVPDDVYLRLSSENRDEIADYISAKMTATWFNERVDSKRPVREIITAEIIYYWMVSNQIPFECENWHLNRLITLIKVCGQKNSPQKKMSAKDIAQRNRELNAARKAQFNTTG